MASRCHFIKTGVRRRYKNREWRRSPEYCIIKTQVRYNSWTWLRFIAFRICIMLDKVRRYMERMINTWRNQSILSYKGINRSINDIIQSIRSISCDRFIILATGYVGGSNRDYWILETFLLIWWLVAWIPDWLLVGIKSNKNGDLMDYWYKNLFIFHGINMCK